MSTNDYVENQTKLISACMVNTESLFTLLKPIIEERKQVADAIINGDRVFISDEIKKSLQNNFEYLNFLIKQLLGI